MTTYKDSGVDVALGDDMSRMLYEAAKLTWDNRKGKLGELFAPNDTFSGLRAMRVGGLPKRIICSTGFDGIGTKVNIAQRMNKHDTVAFDLTGMVTDDAVVRGAEPVLLGSILDVKTLNLSSGPAVEQMRQLAKGYVAAANAADVAVVNGELAEISVCVSGYGEFNYNWGASVLWFADERRMITGEKIKPGHSIVSLREFGYRSNGLSLVRKIMEREYGSEWHSHPEAVALAETILYPTTIYTKAVVDMFGGALGKPKAELTGVAHITGGGIPGKLGRTLQPSGYGAVLYDLHEPPEAMRLIQEMGNVPTDEAYRTWNEGNGMLLITPDPNPVLMVARAHGLEAKVAGVVTLKPRITIVPYNTPAFTF